MIYVIFENYQWLNMYTYEVLQWSSPHYLNAKNYYGEEDKRQKEYAN